MGVMMIIRSIAPVMLVSILIIAVLYFLKSHRFKQNSDSGSKYIMTAPISSNDNELSLGFDIEPAFTDSWENRSWQTEEVQSKFTDRAFQ